MPGTCLHNFSQFDPRSIFFSELKAKDPYSTTLLKTVNRNPFRIVRDVETHPSHISHLFIWKPPSVMSSSEFSDNENKTTFWYPQRRFFFSHFLLTFLYQQILLDGQLQVEGVSAATKRNQVTGSQELTKLAFRFKVVASAFLS